MASKVSLCISIVFLSLPEPTPSHNATVIHSDLSWFPGNIGLISETDVQTREILKYGEIFSATKEY